MGYMKMDYSSTGLGYLQDDISNNEIDNITGLKFFPKLSPDPLMHSVDSWISDPFLMESFEDSGMPIDLPQEFILDPRECEDYPQDSIIIKGPQDSIIIKDPQDSIIMDPQDSVVMDPQELIADVPLVKGISVLRQEVATDFTIETSSAQCQSIDGITPCSSEMVSPNLSIFSSSSDEVFPLTLPPSEMKREKSISDLLQEETHRIYSAKCRRRRTYRIEVLRKKRQQGLISFVPTVRYKQRSNLATSRARISGKFVSEYNYKNA